MASHVMHIHNVLSDIRDISRTLASENAIFNITSNMFVNIKTSFRYRSMAFVLNIS